jgi:uncharacterized ferritin-like protein (DUF455 family)
MGWRAAALLVLCTADAEEKCAAAQAAGMDDDPAEGLLKPPRRPARPPRPLLILPRDAPRRRLGSADGRIALLHALAHIELNAVDLAFDMALRFADEAGASGLDLADFVADWFSVGREEAAHFLMLNNRLRSLGSHYGALPAHDGLWEAAEATADSLLARLAIAPMVLEARGLDVTPGMAARLEAAGDQDSAAILKTIYADEIGHVRAGVRWFDALCTRRGLRPVETFAALVADRYRGGLKPPFNDNGRTAAGMATAYYHDWYGACAETAHRRKTC